MVSNNFVRKINTLHIPFLKGPLNQLKKVKHTFRITLGIILVIVGMVGGLIPIFQGWLFGIPGLIILADYFPPINRILKWAKKKAGYKEQDEKNSE